MGFSTHHTGPRAPGSAPVSRHIFLQVTWLDLALPSDRGTNQSLFPCPTRMPGSLAHPRLDLCSLPVMEGHEKPGRSVKQTTCNDLGHSIQRFQSPEKQNPDRCQDSPRMDPAPASKTLHVPVCQLAPNRPCHRVIPKTKPPTSKLNQQCKVISNHKWGYPQNGWFIGEKPIKMDDLRVPPFMEPPYLSFHFFDVSAKPLGHSNLGRISSSVRSPDCS